jgi:hypothetical protein
MTDEAMNHAFGMSSEQEEDEEDEVSKEEADEGHQDRAQQDGGQQHNYMFLFLVNFYSQLDYFLYEVINSSFAGTDVLS